VKPTFKGRFLYFIRSLKGSGKMMHRILRVDLRRNIRLFILPIFISLALLFLMKSPVLAFPLFAFDDTAATAEDKPININVLANDFNGDDDGNNLSVSSLSNPANGIAVIEVDNTITYNYLHAKCQLQWKRLVRIYR